MQLWNNMETSGHEGLLSRVRAVGRGARMPCAFAVLVLRASRGEGPLSETRILLVIDQTLFCFPAERAPPLFRELVCIKFFPDSNLNSSGPAPGLFFK